MLGLDVLLCYGGRPLQNQPYFSSIFNMSVSSILYDVHNDLHCLNA
jgi:hypothetical protein